MIRNGGVQIYFRAILVFAWKDAAQTAAQEAAERSERVRAQQQVTAEEQERLAAKEAGEPAPQQAADELEKVFEPLRNTDGQSSREMRAAATALSSCLRAAVVSKAAEEKSAKDAARAAESAQEATRAPGRVPHAADEASPRTPRGRPRRTRRGELSGTKDAAAKPRGVKRGSEGSEDAATRPRQRSKSAWQLLKDAYTPAFIEKSLDVKASCLCRV